MLSLLMRSTCSCHSFVVSRVDDLSLVHISVSKLKFMNQRASESGLPVSVRSTLEDGLPSLKDPLQREKGIFHSHLC